MEFIEKNVSALQQTFTKSFTKEPCRLLHSLKYVSILSNPRFALISSFVQKNLTYLKTFVLSQECVHFVQPKVRLIFELPVRAVRSVLAGIVGHGRTDWRYHLNNLKVEGVGNLFI
jgi:hypothetical protein